MSAQEGLDMVKVTLEYGIVVRKAALVTSGITREDLLKALEADAPLDEDDDLVSFGPHFGGTAACECYHRLVELGLEPVDDFFELGWSHPDWLEFSASARTDNLPSAVE